MTALLFVFLLLHPIQGATRDTLPAALSDVEFWALTEQLSEPDGSFRSNSGSPDNLLSNENMVSTLAGALAGRVKPAGVYLGVGPEQNFLTRTRGLKLGAADLAGIEYVYRNFRRFGPSINYTSSTRSSWALPSGWSSRWPPATSRRRC